VRFCCHLAATLNLPNPLALVTRTLWKKHCIPRHNPNLDSWLSNSTSTSTYSLALRRRHNTSFIRLSLTLRGKSNLLRILTTKLCVKLVMLLIDTSVWISVFRDRTGQVRPKLETLINNREVFLTRFTQLELLPGSLNEKEWTLLSTFETIAV
jgi:hypothetical protein